MKTQKIEWTNLRGWFKLSIILTIFISLMFALMTFVGEYHEPIFTKETSVGLGIITIFTSWLFFINTTEEKNKALITPKKITFLVLTIVGMTLVSSVAAFVTGSLVMVAALGLYAWDLSKG